MIDFTNKKILITGATGGIGYALVKKFVSLQGTIVATGTKTEKLDSLKKEFPNISVIKFDISDHSKIEEFIESASSQLTGLDVLVNNAGINMDNLSLRMKDEEWKKVIDVNLGSTFFLCKHAIKKMLKNKYGRIVNITSIVGHTGNLGQSNYAASKAGIIGMSKSLAIEYAKKNITINCVSPGFIQSKMTDNIIESIKSVNYEVTVTDKEVNKRINDIAKNQSNFIDKEPKETAQNEDLITFDYQATINDKNFEGGAGKNTQIVLGKDLFIKGFDKSLLGVKKGQEINVHATLPDNYPTKEYAGKKAIFKCKILSIKKSVPVKIDEQFAKNLGAKDLNDLKKLVNNQIKNQYKMSLDAITKESVMDQIEKLHDFKLPDNLVKQELDLISQGLKKEDLEKNIKESEKIAKKRIKLGLILNELGEINKLKVEDQELKNAIQKQIQSMPGQQKQVLEYYEKNPSASASLRGSIYEEKILNLIIEKSKKTKKIVTIKEAEELIKEQHKDHDHSKAHEHNDDKKSKKPKKAVKSSTNKKKIRKK